MHICDHRREWETLCLCRIRMFGLDCLLIIGLDAGTDNQDELEKVMLDNSLDIWEGPRSFCSYSKNKKRGVNLFSDKLR